MRVLRKTAPWFLFLALVILKVESTPVEEQGCSCHGHSENNLLNCTFRGLSSLKGRFEGCNEPPMAINASFNNISRLADVPNNTFFIIDISNNFIESVDNGILGDQLRLLLISRNLLKMLDISSCNRLRNLRAHSNELETVMFPTSSCRLIEVELQHNKLKVLPEGLSKCKNMKMLNASSNNIKELQPEVLELMKAKNYHHNNTIVDLRNNPISEVNVFYVLRQFVAQEGDIDVVVAQEDCACAVFIYDEPDTRGLVLCISSMCPNEVNIRWVYAMGIPMKK